jgi:hypothetical protein
MAKMKVVNFEVTIFWESTFETMTSNEKVVNYKDLCLSRSMLQSKCTTVLKNNHIKNILLASR